MARPSSRTPRALLPHSSAPPLSAAAPQEQALHCAFPPRLPPPGTIGRYKYDFSYGSDFEDAIAAQFAAGKRAIMLDHHGLYAVGTSARDAWFVTFHLHQARRLRHTSETPPRRLRDTSETPPRRLRDSETHYTCSDRPPVRTAMSGMASHPLPGQQRRRLAPSGRQSRRERHVVLSETPEPAPIALCWSVRALHGLAPPARPPQACEVQLRAQSTGQALVMPSQDELQRQCADMISSPDLS